MKTASALLLLLFASSFAADVVNYEGYKVIRTVPKNELQAGYLEDMQDDVRVSFWSHVRYGLYSFNIQRIAHFKRDL
jgi:hypothetical protein